MIKFPGILLFSVFLVGICLTGCKKEDETVFSNFRIKKEKIYYNDILSNEVNYSYNKERIIRKYSSGNDWSVDYSVTYPDANKIMVVNKKIYSNVEYIDTFQYTYSGERLVEMLYSTWANKYIYNYNSDGSLDEILIYYFNEGGWNHGSTTSYNYEAGKLSEIHSVSIGYNNESKEVYTYNGNEVDEIVYYFTTQNGWYESEKKVLGFTDGKISSITGFYKNPLEDSWDEAVTTTFNYDEHGNLSVMAYIDKRTGENGRTEYIYEGGIGNYQKIFPQIEYDKIRPFPVKSSGFESHAPRPVQFELNE